jgi:hypothetical protein
MKNDIYNLIITYLFIQVVYSLVLWIAFTTSHPLRFLPSTYLRFGLSVLFITLTYMLLGYFAMLSRAKFLKEAHDASKSMMLIMVLNGLSALVYYFTSPILYLSWLKDLVTAFNFPGYLFLTLEPMTLLNLLMIVILPPFAYMIGLLIRQTHH